MADTLVPLIGGKPFQVVTLKGSPYTYHLRPAEMGAPAFCGKKPGKPKRSSSRRVGWYIYLVVAEGRQHLICKRCLDACEDAGAHSIPWLWTEEQRRSVDSSAKP